MLDHTVVEPQAARYLPEAAQTPAHAATKAHANKVALYSSVLHPGDKLLIPAFETYGAVAKPFYDFLRQVAHDFTIVQITQKYPRIAEETLNKMAKVLIAETMRAWQIQISCALLRGRLKQLQQVRSKLRQPVHSDGSHIPLTTLGLTRFLGGRGVAAAYE